MADNNNNNIIKEEKVEWGSIPVEDETENEPEKMLSSKEMNQLNLAADPMEYLYQGDVEITRNGKSEGLSTVNSKTFEELNLTPEILQAVQKMNYKLASTIQTISIPEITAQPYKHFLGQSKSGTGKTAAFTIPLLMRVDRTQQYPQGICVCPTRELAIQNFEIIKQLSQFTGISVGLLIPEVSPEVSNIPAKVKKITNQIIVCTPGIAMGNVSKGILDLKKIIMFVLDEADEMLNEESLQAQTLRIYKAINPKAQIVCFSATFNKTVLAFIDKFYSNAQQRVTVTLKKDDVVVESIFQAIIKVPKTKRIDIQIRNVSINLNFVHNFAQEAGSRINALRGPNRDDLMNRERRKIREEFKTKYGAELNAEFERIRQVLGLKTPNHFTRIDPNQFANDVRGARDLLKIFTDYRELIHAAYPDTSFHWNNKEKLLLKLYEIINIGQTIAFTNERITAKNLAQVMLRDGANVGVLTREEVNNQHLRDMTLQGFRNNDFQFLIATNVLARGINVSAVTLVVNFDIPTKGKSKDIPDYETYIHRIGRTGRWGQTGIALNIITEDDNVASKLLFDIACEYDIQMKNFSLIRDNNTGKVRQIFVDNLLVTTTVEQISAHFGQFGKIESVDLVHLPDNKNVACVTYETSQAASAAIQGTDGQPLPSLSENITAKKDKFDFALYQLYSESRKPDVASISAKVEKISIQEAK